MNNKKRFILPGIAAGLVILILAVAFKPSPSLAPGYDKAVSVDVMPLTMSEISPQIQAFGRVEPKHVWQAVAEVGGKVVYRHPQLETGRLLSKDTLVLAIDPLEYQLKLAQAEANLHATQAQITRLDQQERNLNTSLKIEKQKLVLAEQEYQRKLTLKKRDLVSSSELENQKQSLLAQIKLVEDLQSSLNLLPDDRKVSLAQENVDKALLQDAERRLLQTKVMLPFDARISNVNIEQDQVVSSASVMLVAHQLGTAEVKAELSVQDMRTLVSSFLSDTQPLSMPSIEQFDIQAEVVFQSGGNRFSWPAKVTRVSDTVNPNQGTIGVYLEVEQDFHQLDLLTRPPLTKGMFVSANLYGQSRPQFVIPERALHGHDVYLMDKDSRLVIKPVDVLYRHQQRVAISGEFAQGEVVVLNDLIPAIAGMSLKLVNGNLQRNSASQESQEGDTRREAGQ